MAKIELTTKSGMKVSIEGDANELAEVVSEIGRREKRFEDRRIFFERMSNLRGERNKLAHANPKNKIKKSITEILMSFIEEGFFDKPKRIGEIMNKLVNVEGIPVPSTTIHPLLSRLVAHKKLKRKRGGDMGVWEYMKK